MLEKQFANIFTYICISIIPFICEKLILNVFSWISGIFHLENICKKDYSYLKKNILIEMFMNIYVFTICIHLIYMCQPEIYFVYKYIFILHI